MVQTKERVETHKRMSRIIERAEAPDEQTVQILAYVEAHYETQEVPHGKVYVWWPECFLVECKCSKELIFTSSSSPCLCGADYAAVNQELAEMSKEGPKNVEANTPWREEDYEFVREKATRCDDYYWEELKDLE